MNGSSGGHNGLKNIESNLGTQNYKRLKELISSSTKVYVEFWGIFATNITNNLNTIKLYKLGEKFVAYLQMLVHLNLS